MILSYWVLVSKKVVIMQKKLSSLCYFLMVAIIIPVELANFLTFYHVSWYIIWDEDQHVTSRRGPIERPKICLRLYTSIYLT